MINITLVQPRGRTARAALVVNAETTLAAKQFFEMFLLLAWRFIAVSSTRLQELSWLWQTEEIHGQHNGEAIGLVLLQRNGVANQIIHNSTSSPLRYTALRRPAVYLRLHNRTLHAHMSTRARCRCGTLSQSQDSVCGQSE